MSVIDIIILVVWGIFILLGIKKGFFRETLGLLGVVLGIFLAVIGFAPLSKILHRLVPEIPAVLWIILSFLALFIATYFSSRLLAFVLSKLSSLLLLGWVNRLLGGIAGAFKGALLISLFFLILGLFPFQDILKNTRKNSLLYEPFQRVIPTVYNLFTDFSFSSRKLEQKILNLITDLQGQLNKKAMQYFLYEDD